jgi:hypothetical protein
MTGLFTFINRLAELLEQEPPRPLPRVDGACPEHLRGRLLSVSLEEQQQVRNHVTWRQGRRAC